MSTRTTLLALCTTLLGGAAFAAAPTSQSFDANGVKIHYLVQGSGEPVVLIHGLYSSAAINWQLPGTMAALARNHQVIALDLPGHGRSDKPDRDDAYGVQMAEDVILLMDHLDLKKAHIGGYSLGGMVAMRLIADHPNRVISGAIGGMGWLREGGALQQVWERMAQGQRGPTPAACVRNIGKLGITRQSLMSIQVPIEILVGDRDPVRKLYVDPLLMVRQDWPVIEIPDAGHLNCIVKKEFIDGMVSWIDHHHAGL